MCTILKYVAASAAEAELGTLFMFKNAQRDKIIWLTLKEMGHPQPPTPRHTDNTTMVGIVNSTIKHQRSKAMKMRYFWLLDSEAQMYFTFHHQPGQENLSDYYSKAQDAKHHRHFCPWYLHMLNPPKNFSKSTDAKITCEPIYR